MNTKDDSIEGEQRLVIFHCPGLTQKKNTQVQQKRFELLKHSYMLKPNLEAVFHADNTSWSQITLGLLKARESVSFSHYFSSIVLFCLITVL